MKCLVCGFDSNRDDFCPRCKFPVTMLTDDSEEALRQEQQRADSYRKKLVGSIVVSVNGYAYEMVGEEISLTRKNSYKLGTAQQLQQEAAWLSPKLTNLSTGTADAEVECTLFDKTRQLRVSLKADSQEPELSFGARVDRDMKLHLMLKDAHKQLDDKEFDLLVEG